MISVNCDSVFLFYLVIVGSLGKLMGSFRSPTVFDVFLRLFIEKVTAYILERKTTSDR